MIHTIQSVNPLISFKIDEIYNGALPLSGLFSAFYGPAFVSRNSFYGVVLLFIRLGVYNF